MKRARVLALGLATLLSVALAAPSARAADGYPVADGATVTIDEHGVCQKVTNNHSPAGTIYVHTNQSVEWSSFRSNLPSGVSLGGCGLTYVGGKAQAWAGTTSTTNVSLTDLSGGIATAPQSGDLVVVAFSVAGGANVDVDLAVGGYSTLEEIYRPDTFSTNLAMVAKHLAAADTSITFPSTGSTNNAASVAIHVWRSVDPVLWDVAHVKANMPNYHRPDPPAITPATDGAVILVAGGASHRKGNGTFTSSDLDNFRSAGANDTNDSSVGMGSIVWNTGDGAFDAAQFGFSLGTATDTAESNASIAIVLRPM